MTDLKPLAYGYMRVKGDVDDQVILKRERQLRDYAEEHGFQFGAIFHEEEPGYRGAFRELLKELRRADAHHVIIPSITDLASHPILRHYMLDKLEEISDATIHIADES